MRWFGGLMLILVVAGWVACEMPFSETPTAPQRPPDCWRHTRYGWEQANWIGQPIPQRRPALHPGVVGLLELLVSIMALVAFPAHVALKRACRQGPLRPGGKVPVAAEGRPRRCPGARPRRRSRESLPWRRAG